MKKNIIIIFVNIMLVIFLLLGIYEYKRIELINTEKNKKNAEEYIIEKKNELLEKQSILLFQNKECIEIKDYVSAFDVLNGDAKATIIYEPRQFSEKLVSAYKRRTSEKNRLVCRDFNEKYENDEILVLQFVAWTSEENNILTLRIDNYENNLFVDKTKTTFFVPISNITEIDSLELFVQNDLCVVNIDSMYLVNYGKNYFISDLALGSYQNEQKEIKYLSDEEALTTNGIIQSVKKDNYIFSISTNSLYVYEERGETLKEIAKIDGMNSLRDMEFSTSGQALLLTARQSGLYIIDISNPKKPFKVSHYDTLELTTGISINGNYAFLCSRNCGVEVVDISDLSNPKFVNRIGYGLEYQDCFVDGDYLYIGVYAQKRVDIYNIKELTKPELVCSIQTDGFAQGLYVTDGKLFVSLGINSRNKSSELWFYGKGTGNGFEIYDVRKPDNPILLSSKKVDGRMSIRDNDIWDIKVSGNLAYLTDALNGLYIYDISDIKNPYLVEHFALKISKDKEIGKEYNINIFAVNWKQNEFLRGNFNHVTLENNYLYISSPDCGLFRINMEGIEKEKLEKQKGEYIVNEIGNEITCSNKMDYKLFIDGSSIWAADASNNKIYLACGDNGIYVLDENLNLIQKINTKYSVKDVKVYDQYLFAAESEGGLAIYNIADKVQKIGSLGINPNAYTLSQIKVFDDGKKVIGQTSISNYMIFDVSNVSKPKILENRRDVGLLYFRNIASGDGTAIFGSKNIAILSENNDIIITNENYSETGGYTFANNKLITVNKGVLSYCNIDGKEKKEIDLNNKLIGGKCNSDGELLIVSNTINGYLFIIDIKDIQSPVVLNEIKTVGNPDLSFMNDEIILIPCRYGGLLKINRGILTENN